MIVNLEKFDKLYKDVLDKNKGPIGFLTDLKALHDMLPDIIVELKIHRKLAEAVKDMGMGVWDGEVKKYLDKLDEIDTL